MARYALVIGISEYQSPLSPLPKTTTDAEAVAQLLEQYGDFQSVQRLPMRWNPDRSCYEVGSRQVTGTELGQALRTFLLEQAVKNEALIYFAGHGITVSDNLGRQRGYLGTSDCVIETDGKRIIEQKHGIALDSLNDLIRQSQLSSLVLLLDCCHSGYFLERQLVEQTLTSFSSQKDYYVITACRGFEEAWAMYADKHDVFTGALLNGLSSENASKDGQISGDRLFDSIDRTLKGFRQEPIRMGWGRAITLVTYPLVETASEETVVINRENPYRGLYAFESDQENYFCGREQAVRALLERLRDGRFLSVIGPSGCGKSSLVKAGLLPYLRRDGIPGSSQWESPSFTPGKYPLGRLADILDQRHQQNQPFVLFIDQFEEVFTLCEDEGQRRNFMRLIADEAKSSERLTRVIVAIRGDFLDKCANYAETADLINEARPTAYMVKPLSRLELEEAIEEPATLHGVKFERGLVSQIANDVEDQPGALPLLQYALKELWQVCIESAESPEPCLTKTAYEEIGGVKGALEKRANHLYEETFVSEVEKAFVRQLFMELVQLGEGKEVTRRRASWERLEVIASPEQLQRVVGQLADQRLIVTDEHTVEVAHEALLSEWSLLRNWIEEDRENIRLNRQLEFYCREWQERFQKSDDALLTGARLAAILEWKGKTQPKLPSLEAEYLQKSLEKREHEIQQKIEATKREAEAEARAEAERAKAAEAEARAEAERAKAAETVALVEIEKSIAAKDKAEAEAREAESKIKVQKQRTIFVITIGFLLTVFMGSVAVFTMRQAEIADKGKVERQTVLTETLFDYNDQIGALVESIRCLDLLKDKILDVEYNTIVSRIQKIVYRVQEQNRFQGHTAAVYGLSINHNHNDKLIASSDVDGNIKFWKFNGEKIDDIKVHRERVRNVRFSPNGTLFTSASLDEILNIWNVNVNIKPKDWHYFVLPKPEGRVFDVTFSQNSEKLAALVEKKIILWNTESLRNSLPRTLIDKSLIDPKITIYSINFNLRGSIIAAGFSDGSIRLWDLNTNKDDQPIILGNRNERHSGVVNMVRFSPKNDLLASGSEDGNIKIWSVSSTSSTKLISTIHAHKREIYGLGFSPDSKIIASASADGSIQLWNVHEAIKHQEVKEPFTNILMGRLVGHRASVNRLEFSSSGHTLVSASDDGTVRIWKINLRTEGHFSNTKVFEPDILLQHSCTFLSDYLKINKKLPKVAQVYTICKPHLLLTEY